ncbi:hypothetical protein Athai_01980 [Actinocatenispora thailandica]|uniref:Sulfotransferase family protein n=1 Tax=Actinocatenispora thailandica TaxID=227318 RepID=A0A7R7DJ74_9ACTN|nr:hypothetical protein [Actinocatenispora thailandica]BCJ32695.1 hypothetical protein Athai_01980 [Actinocatenispora thailandica]
MAERIILHVGAPKTGSTYLQNVLWDNESTLRQAGFLLPGGRSAHYQAMGDLRGGLWYEPTAPWTWDRLAAVAADWPGTVIISEEMLGAATAEQCRDGLARLPAAETHVVVTGRDLWRAIPSSWQQAVRARGVGTFTSYVAGLRDGTNPAFWAHQTPLPILQRWGATLPADRRHLVTVPPAGADRDLLWTRFARALGIPAGLCRVGEPASNASLGAVETELLRRVNAALGDRLPLRVPYLRVVRRHLIRPILMQRDRRLDFGLPVELGDWVRDAARRQVAELAAFPCEVDGDLTDLVPGELRERGNPDRLSTAELLDASVQTIVDLLERLESLVETEPAVAAGNPPGRRSVPRRLGAGLRRRLTGG